MSKYQFTSVSPLTEAQIQRFAPSAFATLPHDRVGSRYCFMSTMAMVDGLQNLGWQPVSAMESRPRKEDRQGFTRHMIRLRRFDDALPMVGDSFPELVLTNSHDGSSSYQLHAGLFRLLCMNGMVIANGNLGTVRRRHTGDALGEVIEGSCEIIEELPAITSKVEVFQQIELSHREQEVFAESALQLRWDQDKAPITANDANCPRRFDDSQNSLWHTFQRVQENLTKGGQRGRASTGRRLTTRPVGAVDGNIRLNQSLWALTEKMAELKGA